MENQSRGDRVIQSAADLEAVTFDSDDLVTVVSQDARTGEVLMVAWANRVALEKTLTTRIMHFWSRSRDMLWKKGETSGNTQALVSLHLDCDSDTLLALVDPLGPACHTGDRTCFGAGAAPGLKSADAPVGTAQSVLAELSAILDDRDRERPEGSYTTRLLEDENLRVKKLGEELSELIVALTLKEDSVTDEAADLVYHLMVALKGAGHSWAEVEQTLARRRQ